MATPRTPPTRRAGSVKSRMTSSKVGPTDKEPVVIENGEDLEKHRRSMRKQLRAKRAVHDLVVVKKAAESRELAVKAEVPTPGRRPGRRRPGRRTTEERAVDAVDAMLNDGLAERNLEELADPHLRDLYLMRGSYRLMLRKAFQTVKEGGDGLNQRDAYTAIAVSRDYREIIAEIRAIEDQNQFATTVYDRVIVPLLAGVYQNFTDTLFVLRQLLQQELGENYQKIEPRFQALMIEHGRYMTQRRDETRGTLDSIFIVE